ncbi:hypothetical protein LPW26_14500 [Rhodopseudomonas sp. HC1]|uniref:hypothetical protein n=1 Tax=Rhodopseudomonas infernalis TaxID=2897386 RepID=UPI001EE78311|nr:hypothetical protein [Rhodopseudomonas infernalis]MCG6205858.1 hypothetical protein [Rhodopseudomonas infernalis]
MLTHRYIQAVLARDIADDIKQADSAAEASERQARADEQRQRAEQLSFRFVDLDRRFGI